MENLGVILGGEELISLSLHLSLYILVFLYGQLGTGKRAKVMDEWTGRFGAVLSH